VFLWPVNIKKQKSSLRRKKPCFGAMESNSTRVEFDSIFVESNSKKIKWLFA
jgi:hypothetical protein